MGLPLDPPFGPAIGSLGQHASLGCGTSPLPSAWCASDLRAVGGDGSFSDEASAPFIERSEAPGKNDS